MRNIYKILVHSAMELLKEKQERIVVNSYSYVLSDAIHVQWYPDSQPQNSFLISFAFMIQIMKSLVSVNQAALFSFLLLHLIKLTIEQRIIIFQKLYTSFNPYIFSIPHIKSDNTNKSYYRLSQQCPDQSVNAPETGTIL